MDEQLTDITSPNNDALTKMIERMKPEGVQTILGVISKEIEDYKIERVQKEINSAANANGTAAKGWQEAADIIRHFDSSELVRKHPQAAKNALLAILSVFPPTRIVAGLTMAIPDDVLSGILGFSLSASPDHLLSVLLQHQANISAIREAEYLKSEKADDERRFLVVVTSDDLIFAVLQSLLEHEKLFISDGDSHQSVKVSRWDSDKLAYRIKNSMLDEKVLVIGNEKHVNKIAQAMDTRFEGYGIRYGWIGNCAVLTTDLRKIRSKAVYESFLLDLASMPISENLKKDMKTKLDLRTGLTGVLATPLLAKNMYDDMANVRRQMYCYGIVRFCENHLKEFLGNESVV